MPETHPEAAGREIPRHLGAVFKESIVRPSIYDYVSNKDLVPVLDINVPRERIGWTLENIRVFSDGTLPRPEARWKQVIDEWVTDLKTSKVKVCKTPEEKAGADELELDIKAMMAVSSSARAMEESGGSSARYAAVITQGSEGPDLDRQDSWAEFLLHKDKEKLARVVNNPLVRFFYTRLLTDACFSVPPEWQSYQPEVRKVGGTEVKTQRCQVQLKYDDIDRLSKPLSEEEIKKGITTPRFALKKARDGDLVKYLKAKTEDGEVVGYKGGFNGYIAELLTEQPTLEAIMEIVGVDNEGAASDQYKVDTTALWAAAKLACDAFLVDKYTRWEYSLMSDQQIEGIEDDDLKLKPFAGWGGDPLRSVLQPSFLPRIIKGVYKDEDEVIMAMTDWAFRPDDAFKKYPELIKPIPASMVGHLKHYVRWSDALYTFFGSSMADNIPNWTPRTVEEDLPKIARLLFQVYGAKEGKKDKEGKPFYNIPEKFPIGRHMVGAQIARIISAKALAVALESRKPNFREIAADLFDSEGKNRPFLEVMRFVWGQNLDARSGLIAKFAGGQLRLVFKDNKFNADVPLREAWETMRSNDQDPRTRGKARTINAVGFVLDAIQAVVKSGKR